MNKAQQIGAMRGILEALIEAQPNLTPARRTKLLDALMQFTTTDDPNPVVHLIISALGGDSEKLIGIPERDRKKCIYLQLADEMEQHIPEVVGEYRNQIVDYLESYTRFYREMPPIVKGEPLTESAAETWMAWQNKQKEFSSVEMAALRDELYRLSKKTSDMNVKTTLLMNWVFMARDIDWEQVTQTKRVSDASSIPTDPYRTMLDRVRRSTMKKIGLGSVESQHTMTQLLDENLEGGAKSVNSEAFMKLCSMTGPEVYLAIIELANAEKNAKLEKSHVYGELGLRSMGGRALYRMASNDNAAKEVAKLLQKRADFRLKLEEAGLETDEIDTQMGEYERFVFEAYGNSE